MTNQEVEKKKKQVQEDVDLDEYENNLNDLWVTIYSPFLKNKFDLISKYNLRRIIFIEC